MDFQIVDAKVYLFYPTKIFGNLFNNKQSEIINIVYILNIK